MKPDKIYCGFIEGENSITSVASTEPIDGFAEYLRKDAVIDMLDDLKLTIKNISENAFRGDEAKELNRDIGTIDVIIDKINRLGE